MGKSGHNDIRPDLIGDDGHIVLPKQLHGLLQLPALPDAAAGVVRGTENRQVDVLVPELLFHIGVVHPPDALLVSLKLTVHGHTADVLQHVGKAHVGRGVEQQLFTRAAQHLDGCADAAEHAVFVADVLREKALCAVAALVPGDDALVIGGRGAVIAEERKVEAAAHGLENGRSGGEAHIRDPHGNDGEALLHVDVGNGVMVGGNGVFPEPIEDCGEIVCHVSSTPVQFVLIVAQRRSFYNFL